MKCLYCGYPIPDDSEFCQFCGKKLETNQPEQLSEETPLASANPIIDDVVPVQPALEIEAESVVEPKFPVEAPVPVETPVEAPVPVETPVETSVLEETPVEMFVPEQTPVETLVPVVSPIETSVLVETPTEAPVDEEKESQKKTKPQRFCKKCGSPIDRATKKCTGCGKQFFRIRKLVAVILFLLMLAFAGLNVFQYMRNQDNLNKIKQLENTLSEKESTIKAQKDQISTKTKRIIELAEEVSDLKRENRSYASDLSFYEKYAGIVPDDGSNLYHIHSCNNLDTSYFWIYNIEAAEQRGYYPCPKCH